jgi:hypothetical protein
VMNSFSGPLARSFLANMLAGVLLWLACLPADAHEQSLQLEVIAAQVRRQGFVCKNPISVERIEAGSRPDEPLYVIKCEGASYRVRLIPDRAAEIFNEHDTRDQSE